MNRIWIVAPLALLAVVLIGLIALGLPPGAPTPTPYEKTLATPTAH